MLGKCGLASWVAVTSVFGGSRAKQQPHPNYTCHPLRADLPQQAEESWQLCAPQLIVAGAEKSGTTSLYEYLKAHPDFLPVQNTYIFDRELRARIVRTVIRRATKMRSDMARRTGKPAPRDHRHDVNRWLRLGNLSKEEVMDVEPETSRFLLEEMRFPDMESHALPVRMGKEVRFWMPKVLEMLQALGKTRVEGYAYYVGLFPKIPMPPKDGDQELPEHLAPNLYKVTGEASPQYLDVAEAAVDMRLMQPRSRVVFLFRDPTKRYWSQACMVDQMSPDNAPDPKLPDFDKNVRFCIGGQNVGKPHPTVQLKNGMPGGTGLSRMQSIDWSSNSVLGSSAWVSLSRDLMKCFSHGTGQFLLKSMYVSYMRRWLNEEKGLMRSQVLTLSSEELFGDTVGAMHKVSDFLGLRRIDDAVWLNQTAFKHTPHFNIRKLEWSLDVDEVPRKTPKSGSGSSPTNKKPITCTTGKKKTEMTLSTREYLDAFYYGPNCALQKLLQVNWSRWGWPACADFGDAGNQERIEL